MTGLAQGCRRLEVRARARGQPTLLGSPTKLTVCSSLASSQMLVSFESLPWSRHGIWLCRASPSPWTSSLCASLTGESVLECPHLIVLWIRNPREIPPPSRRHLPVSGLLWRLKGIGIHFIFKLFLKAHPLVNVVSFISRRTRLVPE